MKNARTLKMTAPTHTVLEGGGFPVRRPTAMGRLMSPFLLLDEMGPVHWDPGQAIGAPAHPHRGFETVTYMIQGAMKHEDSACLLYTSPSPRDATLSRMPSSA